ncbi:MAG: hypothetical protein IKI67_02775, partial [Bacteroidales bacterium]|nr:hypothetical protein [Bacteroidales bacterium]
TVTVTQAAAEKAAYEAPDGYKLVWHDEFDEGTELNSTAFGSSLASLSLNQSKNINKINNNESKNTDIQRHSEGLRIAVITSL